jgi:phosphomannomutase/phosphoglucomutase
LKEAGGPAAGNEGLALGTFWRLAYVAAALVLTLALVGAAVIFHANEARLIERHLRAYSATVAQELGNRVAAVRGQLKRWSVDPGVRAALLDGRVAALRAKEEELALLIPGALDVMLFSTDGTAAGGEAARRLSFAGLDMVQRVQDDGRIAALEAHRVRQADEHLGIAGPIVDDTEGRVIGIVHVMLPMSLLPKTAGSADADARFAFRQQVGDTRVVLRPGVADAPSDGVVSAQLPIPDTRLELFAWVRPTSLLGSQLLPFLGGLYLISLLLLGAAIGFPARDLRLRTNADLVNLTALAEDAAAQQPLRPTRGRVRELSAATDALRRSLRKLAPVRELQPKPAELAPTSDGTSLLEVYEQSIDFELDLPSTDGSVPGPSSALPGAAPSSSGFDGRAVVKVPPQIFRAYDIRGLVGPELTDQVLYALGLAVGSEAAVQGQCTCIVARDQRASGEGFARALVAGL